MKKALSARFEKALVFATRAHGGQIRKGSGAPYISHPIAVASLVLEYGGNEAQAVAALLHDVIEDCGITRKQLERRFGRAVARMVDECSDSAGPKGAPKKPWRERKERYIAHLKHATEETLLVSAADKLHNARAIVHDVLHHGPKTWARFSAKPPAIAWYYESLIKVYKKRFRGAIPPIVTELEAVVRDLSKLAATARKRR